MDALQKIAVVGGGPAGLRAAEVLAESGRCDVTVFEQKRSVGRKFLVAGRGGLNLSHSEKLPDFVGRYSEGPWAAYLAQFGPEDTKKWAGDLGSETFVGSSGRIFPVEKQAARLLRRWVSKLRALGVQFVCGERLTGIATAENGVELSFQDKVHLCDATVLALGGASWPETGSDGQWPALLEVHGIEITPWTPANCGWEVAWPEEFRAKFEGQPWKNLSVSAAGRTVRGEMLITRYGLEGGCLYLLGPSLRAMQNPTVTIDFRPDSTKPTPLAKLPASVRWWLENNPTAEVHCTSIPLLCSRPIAEAISSAGGIAWQELDATLRLQKLPNVWAVGEMIDWEASTGGYLLQGCLTTGTVAARGILQRK